MSQFRQFDLEDVINIYVTLEQNMELSNLTGPSTEDVRDEVMLLNAISGYSNHKIDVFEEDLYDTITESVGRSRDYYSKCLIFHGEVKKRAEIWVNSHKLLSGAHLVNSCWRRFCIIKEACQVIIREEFLRHDWVYPATKNVEELVTLYRNLVKFKFSIFDFDNEHYPLDTKVENAAEILAILLLYPIEKMVADAERLNGDSFDSAFSNSFYEIADNYKVPERYVELFLTSEELGRMDSLIQMKR